MDRATPGGQPLGRRVGAGIHQPDEGLRAGLVEERRRQVFSFRCRREPLDLAHGGVRLAQRQRHRQVLAALGEERLRLPVAQADRHLSRKRSPIRWARREGGGGRQRTAEAVELQDPREVEGARQVEGEAARPSSLPSPAPPARDRGGRARGVRDRPRPAGRGSPPPRGRARR